MWRRRALDVRVGEHAGAFTRQAAQTIAAECRKAGLPVGSS